MRVVLCVILPLALLGGCINKITHPNTQPYVTEKRLNRGLVMVLTGIEGRSGLNEAIVKGINDGMGAQKYAIELCDWTSDLGPIWTQEDQKNNRRKARSIADRVRRYRWRYPDRPVVLVGQSGGGAMAAWIAENMEGEQVDGIIMLACSLSPGYRLDKALAHSERGIVSFHSSRDVIALGFFTKVIRTMDGEHSACAGNLGFIVPKRRNQAYSKLFQIGWNEKMAATGHKGMHLTSGTSKFVAMYVAPFVKSYRWDRKFVSQVVDSNSISLSKADKPAKRTYRH